MVGWFAIIMSAYAMAKIAEIEGRSPVAWGGLTLLICIACVALIPLSLLSIGIGLVLSFLVMFICKLVQKN